MEAPDEPSGEGGPDERAEASWLAWRVHRALEQLPDHGRPVIELAYWGGLSQSEISTFLDIPLGTIKTRTRSALARSPTCSKRNSNERALRRPRQPHRGSG